MEDRHSDLFAELTALRQRIAELEATQAEHEQLKQRLQESEHMVEALLGSPFHAVVILDLQGIVINANETMACRLGRSVDELIGRCGWDLLPPELARRRKAYADHVFQSGQPVRVEDERQGIWSDNVFQPIFNERGEVVKIAVVVRDITEQKQMETRLRQSEQRVRALLNASTEGAYLIDLDGTIMALNEPGASSLGKTVDELVGTCVFNLFPSPVAEFRRARTSEVAHTGQPVRFEDQRQGRWFDSHVFPVFNEEGEIHRVGLFVRDITELKRAQEELHRFFSFSFDMLCIAGFDGYMKYVNPAFEKTLGHSVEEILAQPFLDFVHPEDRAVTIAEFERLAAGATISYFEHRCRCKDGSYKWLAWTGVPVAEEGLMYAAARNITERKRVKEEMDRYRYHLEELVEERTAELRAEITERKRAEERGAYAYRLLLALSQAGQAVQQARSPQDIYRLIGEEVKKLGLQVVVFNVGEDHRSLTIHYITSWPRAQKWSRRLLGLSPEDIRIPLAPDGFFQPIIEGGTSRFCQDSAALSARGFPRLGHAVFEKLLTTLGIRRSIYAPLTVGGRTRQLLCVLGEDLTEADVPAVTGFANQAAIALDNARLLEELTASGEQMRHLAQRIINAQEEERQRLSRALHDEAGQALTALRISLELLREDLADDAHAPCERVNDAIALTTQTMEELRTLAQNLRPPALDAVGLDQALAGVCRDFARRTQIAVDYRGAELPPLSEALGISLYRLLQEALTNAARHAHASRIDVALDCDSSTISLSIQDDGQGFNAQAILRASEHAPGMGLLGIRERLEMLGGQLEITSRPGQGTRLVGRIPLGMGQRGKEGGRDD